MLLLLIKEKTFVVKSVLHWKKWEYTLKVLTMNKDLDKMKLILNTLML